MNRSEESHMNHTQGNGKARLGVSQTRPAGWLDGETGQLPPVAFAVPIDDVHWHFIQSAPPGPAGQEKTTEWATKDFGARYQGLLVRFENESKLAGDKLACLESRIDRCRRELARTPVSVVTKLV